MIWISKAVNWLRRPWPASGTALAALAAIAYVLLTQYAAHRQESAQLTLPVRAVQTRAAARWKTQQVPGCPPVQELLPPAKDRARLERDFGVRLGRAIPGQIHRTGAALAGDLRLPDVSSPPAGSAVLSDPGAPATHVLGLFAVPRMRNGGEALATLPPDGRLDLTFRANPPRFLGFRPTWGAGALLDPTQPADRWTGYALLEPLHLRERWHLRLTAGAEARDGQTRAIFLTGIEYRKEN